MKTDQAELRRVWEIRSPAGAEPLLKDTPEQALMAVEFLAVQALLEHPLCPLSLHSALVAKNGKGIVILGPSEAGKSTLACALWQRGWSLLGDDVTLIDVEQGTACPSPRRVSLRTPSRALLGEELWTRVLTTPSCLQTGEGCVFHPHEIDGREQPHTSRLGAIIFLARRGVTMDPATLQRLDPAHALLALLPYSNVVRMHDPGEALRRIRPLAVAAPAYDLGRGPLAAMIESIERMFAGVA